MKEEVDNSKSVEEELDETYQQLEDNQEEEEDLDYKWYVVHTYTGYENKIKDALDRVVDNHNLRKQIKQIRIPTHDVVEKKGGKTVVTEKNLYPGYLFLEMAMSDDVWYTVKNTSGVTGFVGPTAKPSPLKEEELIAMGLAERPVVIEEFSVGDSITVIDGPLEGFTGTIEEMMPNQNKVRVNLSMFGRLTPTELEYKQIHKINE